MGLRCCLKLNDKDAGEGLARGCRSMVRSLPSHPPFRVNFIPDGVSSPPSASG